VGNFSFCIKGATWKYVPLDKLASITFCYSQSIMGRYYHRLNRKTSSANVCSSSRAFILHLFKSPDWVLSAESLRSPWAVKPAVWMRRW
jgi:hypothetical protein